MDSYCILLTQHFVVENVLLFVFPYMAWMLAESLELSGIVAILFCGFGMAHYTALSLSKEARPALLGSWDTFQGPSQTRTRYAAC